MPMTVNDPIRASPRGDPQAALEFAQGQDAERLDEVRAFVREVFRLAPLVGLDPAILVAQSAEETGNWTSPIWTTTLNPAGIGITDTSNLGLTYDSGVDAAHAQIVHAYVYVIGQIPAGHVLAPFVARDPRYQAVIAAGFAGAVRTIHDLTGKWASDPHYHETIVSRGNLIFPVLAAQEVSVMGHVPKPPVIQSWVDKEAGHGPDEPRAGFIVGTCHHTMVGFLRGTDSFFHDPNVASLTDYGIGGPWDGDDLDGVIFEWIDPESDIVPWANGTVGEATAPFGDGQPFLDAFGVNGVNRRLRSIETSDGSDSTDGLWDRDKGGREIESLCFLTAWIHAEQAGQTAETFAWNMHHREFGVDHQPCPGAWIIHNVDQIQARTKAIMRAYQEDTPLNPLLNVTYPRGWTGDKIRQPGDRGDDRGGFEPFGAVRKFHAQQGAIGRAEPKLSSPVKKSFQAGDEIGCDGILRGELVDGDDCWVRTSGPQHLAIHSSGIAEKI